MGFLYRLFRKSDDGKVVMPKTGTNLYPSLVAENQTYPGIPVKYAINIAAGAVGNTDVIVPAKVRVLDAYLILKGGGVATTTAQVFNGANAISSTMAASGSDTAVVRCTTINDAYWDIAAGGTLRVTTATGASQPDCVVIVEGVLIA
jgi:hypothetical protein